MAEVTGIGGVFFKAEAPRAPAQWYAEHLGVSLEAWGGAIFDWSADQRVQSARGVPLGTSPSEAVTGLLRVRHR